MLNLLLSFCLDEAPTARGAFCRSATPCPATCLGLTCDEIMSTNDFTCNYLEQQSCDCRGCACDGEERLLAWPEAHDECCEVPEACSDEACDLVTGGFFVCFAAQTLDPRFPTPEKPSYYTRAPDPYYDGYGCVSCCDARLTNGNCPIRR